MTPWSRLATREAFVLPLLLLAIAAGGGFRADVASGAWRFLPPTPMTLVLGVLLLGVLVRTGVLAPWVLIGPHRTGLANGNGALLLAALLLASAQVFMSLTPEGGLLQVLAGLFFLLLLVNTLAARPTRARAMQSLGVVLLSAFVLKYVVLDSLYAPEGSLARKVVTTLLEGVSLGALGYVPHGSATACVAFVVLLAYLFVLVLLPGDDVVEPADGRLERRDGRLEPGDGRRGEASLPAAGSGAPTREGSTRSSDERLARRDPADR